MSVHTVSANGAQIPALGLGTSGLEDEVCVRSVTAAIAAGYRHIDTASRYENEEAIGEGIAASRHPRSDLFVTTKVYWTDLAPADLERSAEASLKRLRLDHVDLLLIHWPSTAVPLAASLKALAQVQARGLARHIGVANFPSRLLEEAVVLSTAPLVCNQCEYHPYLDQSTVLSACRRHGMAFTSYSPLCKARPGGLFDAAPIVRIAAAHRRSPAEVVLRWHIQQPGVVAIPRSSNPDRIKTNLQAGSFELSAAEMSEISALVRPDGRNTNPKHAPAWD